MSSPNSGQVRMFPRIRARVLALLAAAPQRRSLAASNLSSLSSFFLKFAFHIETSPHTSAHAHILVVCYLLPNEEFPFSPQCASHEPHPQRTQVTTPDSHYHNQFPLGLPVGERQRGNRCPHLTLGKPCAARRYVPTRDISGHSLSPPPLLLPSRL